MENEKVVLMNGFINSAYDCHTFHDFLKLTILKLHELVAYDSGMFFCSLSKDCSFFKPYITGDIKEYFEKRKLNPWEAHRYTEDAGNLGKEAYVYKALDYAHGLIHIENEPRKSFISDQNGFHIVCARIIYKGEFLGEIYLHRSREEADFDEEDLLALRLLQPHVSTVFSIIHMLTAVECIDSCEPHGSQKGMCMFDRELSLIDGSMSGTAILKMSTDLGSCVLYHIKEQCQEMIAENPDFDGDRAILRSFDLKIQNSDLRVDIFANKRNGYGNGGRFVVTMEFVNESQTFADYKFKFSKREAEVIDGLIQGKNNGQLAGCLNLSENTVKTHIKNIYKKTGANNRTELVYMLMLNK